MVTFVPGTNAGVAVPVPPLATAMGVVGTIVPAATEPGVWKDAALMPPVSEHVIVLAVVTPWSQVEFLNVVPEFA
jgi:hypothetical protein